MLRVLGVEVPYPLVALIAFTPYAALTSPLPVVLALILRRKGVALVAGVAALALGATMVPRAVAGPRPEAEGPRLVVMTSNLWLGQAERARAAADRARARRGRAERAGAAAEDAAPSSRPTSSRTGSCCPTRARPEPGCSRRGRSPRPAVSSQPEAVFELDGAPPVRIKAVHPRPPVNRAAEPEWRKALAALPGADEQGDVQILAGDFNATLDHSEFRALLDRGYHDAADAAGEGWTPTWPAPPKQRRALPLTIDHILVDRRVRVEQVTVVRIPRSDHRAVIAVLRLPSA